MNTEIKNTYIPHRCRRIENYHHSHELRRRHELNPQLLTSFLPSQERILLEFPRKHSTIQQEAQSSTFFDFESFSVLSSSQISIVHVVSKISKIDLTATHKIFHKNFSSKAKTLVNHKLKHNSKNTHTHRNL